MSRRELFWERVNAACDARRNPLDEPSVRELLVDEPELLRELTTLDSALAVLRQRPQRSRRRVAALAALAVVCIGVGAFALFSPTRHVAEPRAFEMTADAGHVLAFEVETVRESTRSRTTRRFDGACVAIQRTERALPSVLTERRATISIACADHIQFTR